MGFGLWLVFLLCMGFCVSVGDFWGALKGVFCWVGLGGGGLGFCWFGLGVFNFVWL